MVSYKAICTREKKANSSFSGDCCSEVSSTLYTGYKIGFVKFKFPEFKLGKNAAHFGIYIKAFVPSELRFNN